MAFPYCFPQAAHYNHLGKLRNPPVPGTTPRDADLIGLRWEYFKAVHTVLMCSMAKRHP